MGHNSPIGLLAGPKIAGRHTTVTKFSRPVIDSAKKLDCVSKVIIGRVAHTGTKQQKLVFTAVLGGLKVKVWGDAAIQELTVQTTNPAETQKKIEEAWEYR